MEALVADDNQICTAVAKVILERAGFLVAIAINGADAVAAASEKTFSVILMDCDMPELDGLDATLAIRQIEQGEHALIIGVTSRANRQDCLAVGMDDHIQKPLTRQALAIALHRWGWTAVESRKDLTDLRASLSECKREMNEQAKRLVDQNNRLQTDKDALSDQLWDGTSNQVAAERHRLADWEDSLRRREWALETRSRFLARREASVRQIDSGAFAS